MIDWTKERTDKNYCGWCIGSPPTANCNGSCFTRKDYTFEELFNNRKAHLEAKLNELPELHQDLIDREKELLAEFDRLMAK